MLGMVPDNDIEGHFAVLFGHVVSPTWRDLWSQLGIQVHYFRSLGLARSSSDRVVWQTCQDRQLILITGNRNDDGPDSLEATIRESNTLQCLPVLTLSHAKRISQSGAYAEQAAERLLEILIDIDNMRGTGRIWLP